MVAALTAPAFRAVLKPAAARGARLFAPAQEAVRLKTNALFPVPGSVRPGEPEIDKGRDLCPWPFGFFRPNRICAFPSEVLRLMAGMPCSGGQFAGKACPVFAPLRGQAQLSMPWRFITSSRTTVCVRPALVSSRLLAISAGSRTASMIFPHRFAIQIQGRVPLLEVESFFGPAPCCFLLKSFESGIKESQFAAGPFA